MYPSAGLVRYSTVGGPAPVSTCWIRAARPARPERAEPASPPGLEEFLQRLHLASYTEAVKVWCEEQGACELSELVENAEDLAKTLRFPPNKAQEIKVKGPAFVKAIEKPKISKAISAPPAALAPPAPTRVLGQLGADVLRAAFMPKALEMKEEENAAKPGLASTDRTETDLWDEREARCHLQAMQDPCLFYSAEVPDDSLKKFSGERYYYRGYVEPHLLRQRNPTEAELKVKERASAEAKEQLDAAWGDVADSPPSMPRAQQRAQAARHAAFEDIRQEFLSQFEGNLQQELGKGYKLTPADVHPRVKEKFVEESKSLGTGALDYGYHGTRQANIPSILGTGLKVPGNESGVRVANGSAHGVGIYTGMPGNLWISQNFSDSKNMLICGVLDPDAPPRPKVAMPSQAAVTTTTQRLKATHRPHRRPVVAAAAAPPPAPVFSCTEFRTNDEIKVVGAARVIFKEERVAPLFIAQPAASDRSFTYQEATPGSEPLRGGSKGQVYIPESGEVVWDCWEPTGGAYGRRLKRRVVQKERQQERASLRLLKRTEQEAS